MGKKSLFLFIILVIIFSLIPNRTSAAPNIKLSYDVGMEGKVKEGSGFPLKITVENNGDTFKGDLVIYFGEENTANAGQVIPIQIGQGEKKVYSISIPSYTDFVRFGNTNEDMVILYDGSWDKGKKVKFTGDKYLSASILDNSLKTIGILSENPDRLKNLRGYQLNQLQFINVTEENFPNDAIGLQLLDMLIIDGYTLSTLTNEQQLAVMQWANLGGTLVVGGTTDAKAKYGMLFEDLPLKYSGEMLLQNANLGFKQYGDITIHQLQIFTGPVSEELIQVKHGGHPLIVEKPYGSGKIIQTAFSLGDDPVTKTEGYSEWFANYLAALGTNAYSYTTNSMLFHQIGNVNELFPGSNFSLTQLSIILLIYILILVPLLYFILKRKDKRERAWLYIPSIAIVTSILIFAIGAKDRIASPVQNELGLYLAENNSMSGIHVVSFQSNTSGDYSIQANSSEYNPVPNLGYLGFTGVKSLAHVTKQNNLINITYPNVPYWSVRTMLGNSYKVMEQNFTTDLTVNNRKLAGTVTNNFPYDLTDVHIWSGHNRYNLGDFKQGETKTIDIQVQEDILQAPLPTGYGYLQNQDVETARKESLENSINEILQQRQNKPIISGYTKENIVDVKMTNRKAKVNRLSLILQPIDINYSLVGEFTLTASELNIELVVVNRKSNDKVNIDKIIPGEDFYMEPGVYDIVYHLPNIMKGKSLKLTELTMQVFSNTDKTSIINHTTGEFLDLQKAETGEYMRKFASEFLSNDGKIIIRLEKQNPDYSFIIPVITVKGEIEE